MPKQLDNGNDNIPVCSLHNIEFRNINKRMDKQDKLLYGILLAVLVRYILGV